VSASSITTVAAAEADGALLRGCRIDRPTEGSESDRHAFSVVGWALGACAPLHHVDLVNQGQVIQTLAVNQRRPDIAVSFADVPWADTAGYAGIVSTLLLEPEFMVSLVGVFDDGTRVQLGAIYGTAAPLATDHEPLLQPLMVTTLGRSGSTALMHLVSQIPGVACGMRYPYELRLSRFWSHCLSVMTSPADHANSAASDGFADNLFWSGRNPFHDPHAGVLGEWLATDHVRATATFVQLQLDAAYNAIAEESGHGPVRFFAEKTVPDRYSWILRRLYPHARELFLVRDFRDMYCSIASFNRKRGYLAFGREQAESELAYIRKLAASAHAMHRAWTARSSTAMLIRYEALVEDPLPVLQAILEYIGLDESAADAEEIVERARSTEAALQDHRTTALANESVGRWRRDLPEPLREECARTLDESLALFGYEPTLSHV
jgi:LPS sulfotransferase NodH